MKHFKGLLNGTEQREIIKFGERGEWVGDGIGEGRISEEEIFTAINRLGLKKAAGRDQIPGEAWKWGRNMGV